MNNRRDLTARFQAVIRAARLPLPRGKTRLGQAKHLGSSAGRVFANLVFPPRCAWCAAEADEWPGGIMLCDECRRLLAGPAVIRCSRCGAALAVVGGACADCHGRARHFDGVVPLGTYAAALRECVLRLKRAGHESLATVMGQLLFAEHQQPLAAARADAILPVPMHWLRRVSRRANSAELLAATLARKLDLPLLHRPLRRIRNTRQQGPMLRTERLHNVRGAFRLDSEIQVTGKRLLLVDDVLTTGATCDEIAKILKRAGAAAVVVAVLARSEAR